LLVFFAKIHTSKQPHTCKICWCDTSKYTHPAKSTPAKQKFRVKRIISHEYYDNLKCFLGKHHHTALQCSRRPRPAQPTTPLVSLLSLCCPIPSPPPTPPLLPCHGHLVSSITPLVMSSTAHCLAYSTTPLIVSSRSSCIVPPLSLGGPLLACLLLPPMAPSCRETRSTLITCTSPAYSCHDVVVCCVHPCSLSPCPWPCRRGAQHQKREVPCKMDSQILEFH
jgi:hypothetical protein